MTSRTKEFIYMWVRFSSLALREKDSGDTVASHIFQLEADMYSATRRKEVRERLEVNNNDELKCT